jgi:stage V sporulation protein G
VEITEVRIKLMEEAGERLQAFCSITFDNCFVIRDLKIIEGTNGPFVAMPSRKLTAHCPQCGCKNHLRAAHCNQCGLRLKDDRAVKDEDGRAKLYADIAHPINSACREQIQERVIKAFRSEVDRSKLPGYVSSYDDFDEDITFAAAGPPRCQPRSEPARITVTRVDPPAPRPEPERPMVEKAAPEKAMPAKLAVENAKIQPAEPEPRGPHKSPATAPQRSSFGAGIL